MKKQKQEQTLNSNNEPRMSGWVYISIGIILICFCLVGALAKAGVGQLITYCLSFLFGMFYPLVLVLGVVVGLRLIFAKSLFPVKGHVFPFVGVILLVLAAISFGSFGLYSSQDGGVSFLSLNSVYCDRMRSFASGPFSIDSYAALGGLGGGYIGLFLTSLLGALWGIVGNSIFFGIILAAGLFFVLLKPICQVIDFFKARKANQVKYQSPYQPNKEKSHHHLFRQVTGDEQVNAPEPEPVAEPEPEPLTKPEPATFTDDWQTPSSSPFTAVGTPSQETYEDNISAQVDDVFTPAKTAQANRAQVREEPIPEPQPIVSSPEPDPFTPAPVTDSPFTPVSQPSRAATNPNYAPAPSFQPKKIQPKEDNPFSTVYSSRKDDEISRQAQEFHDSYHSPEGKTVEVLEPSQPLPKKESAPLKSGPVYQEEKPVYQAPAPEPKPIEEPEPEYVAPAPTPAPAPVRPNYNPLENVGASKPKASSSPATFTVNVAPAPAPEPEPEPEPEPVEKTEEDIENEKAEQYFRMKQQQKMDELMAKKKAKDEKIASLMRFVSDTPKDFCYALPNDTMLEEIDDSAKVEKNQNAAQEKAAVINKVFDEFGVKAKAISFTIGASVTRFNVETERGEKADKIANLTSEFQRALNGDMSVRVETVVEGKSTSGIEIGNAAPMAVSFKDMFVDVEQNTKDPLLLPIGKDISGEIVSFPLNKMPHMLVAGTTGSGKSVLVHSFIMTIMMRTYPSQCKFILIDPKQVEFIRYQDCSHLFCPVISKPESAILALNKLCVEMDRRFTVLSKNRCANLDDYNNLRKGHEHQYEQMPFIVCVIDEFADLMQTGGKEVTQYVTRIAQKARACGIHLIIATQRPSKDNVPMIIKANVPSRIGLLCSSQVDSRVILDEIGAETLLGRGDLLFKCPGKKSLIRAQSPYISDSDIRKVLDYIHDNAGDPCYDPNFLDLDVESPEEEEEVNPEGSLYDDICEFVIKTGITSKSSLMKNFQISSAKADQFIAKMNAEAIIILGGGGKYVLGPAAAMGDR